MESIGDYVEVSGDLNDQAKTLRIGSLKAARKRPRDVREACEEECLRQKQQLSKAALLLHSVDAPR